MSMILRQLIQVDQIDGCNSMGVELMFRRVQTIENAHSEKARELESKTVGGKLSLEKQYTFASLVRQAGTLMIAPALLNHVKIEVEKDVQLQKNMREAREERDILTAFRSTWVVILGAKSLGTFFPCPAPVLRRALFASLALER